MNIGNEMIRAMQDCNTTKALRRPAGSQRKNFRITTAMYTSFVTTMSGPRIAAQKVSFIGLKNRACTAQVRRNPADGTGGDYCSQETR